MPAFFKFKDAILESRLISSRVLIAGIVASLFVIIVLYRIFHLQVVLNEHYSTLSQSNRVKVVPIAPTRGLIFSSDSVLLADNRPSFSLEIIPEKVDDMDMVLQRLANVMDVNDLDISQFKTRLKQNRRFESIPLVYNLSDEEVARISVDLHKFQGVDIIARLNRYYPLGSITSHSIGYMGMIDENELALLNQSNYIATSHIGKIGVEKAYENLLHGKVGNQQVEVNVLGRVIRVLDKTPPIPGKNIYLTLNASVQNLAVKALEGRRGAIVALDPMNGGILAMVSSPGYDPNQFVYGIDTKTYGKYLNSDDSPLLNRALQGKYPPGSTIKPILGLAALRYGVRTSDEETWCPGWYILKGTSLKKGDWKKQGHGHTSLRKAIAESCDVYFYSLANELGIDRIYDSMSEFGIGRKTNVDIGGESSGLMPSRDWKRRAYNEPWYPGETLNIGIGQGAILVTPIQLAIATAAIANHGKVMKPRLLFGVRDPMSKDMIETRDTEIQNTISYAETDWVKIISAMTDVVHGASGTARRIGMKSNYKIAGKSGTAQVFSLAPDEKYEADKLAKELHDHALFVAFAPVDNPKIAIAIIIENGGGGSTIAAPIARLIFDEYLDQIDLPNDQVEYETTDIL
ncbi:MAG: penicillin-binding protein 2 [Gammaproteobacteria bacterium]|jgi:penicillin-binding protein 2